MLCVMCDTIYFSDELLKGEMECESNLKPAINAEHMDRLNFYDMDDLKH